MGIGINMENGRNIWIGESLNKPEWLFITSFFFSSQSHHSPSMVNLPSMFERKYHTFSRSTTHLFWDAAAREHQQHLTHLFTSFASTDINSRIWADRRACRSSNYLLKYDNLVFVHTGALHRLSKSKRNDTQPHFVNCTEVRDALQSDTWQYQSCPATIGVPPPSWSLGQVGLKQ